MVHKRDEKEPDKGENRHIRRDVKGQFTADSDSKTSNAANAKGVHKVISAKLAVQE